MTTQDAVKRPKVGIGVIIINDGKVLLGKRKNAHGDGSWSFPGGHLEYGETWEQCAVREVSEEVGVDITNLRFVTATNDIFEGVDATKHYVTIFMAADYVHGTPETLEPDKCECWEWHEWDSLPRPLFLPITHLIASGYKP